VTVEQPWPLQQAAPSCATAELDPAGLHNLCLSAKDKGTRHDAIVRVRFGSSDDVPRGHEPIGGLREPVI